MHLRNSHRAGLALLLLVALSMLFVRRPVPRASGPLPQQAYIWQRSWGPAVHEAIGRSSGQFAMLTALAAEVSWDNGQPRPVRVQIDHDALRTCGQPVGLALRIGPYSGPFDQGGNVTRELAGLAQDLVSEWSAAGVRPAEVQIDFDCPESRLDGYRLWVEAIRTKITPIPIIVTALPSWLDRRAFAKLAWAADGFVLQVHSLQRPTNPDQLPPLCDPAAAREAVEKAARVGRPFRVALPTYGYLVAFDAGGKYLGVSAEEPARAWPADAKVRDLRADPAAMAQLVKQWMQDRPAALQGIIWYRMPTDEDQLNWRWPTLQAVMAGQVPAPALRAAVRRPEPGLIEIDLVNEGQADAPLQVDVVAEWGGSALLAADALGGFERAASDPESVAFRATSTLAVQRLSPGERRAIGWLRFDKDTEVRIHVTATKP